MTSDDYIVGPKSKMLFQFSEWKGTTGVNHLHKLKFPKLMLQHETTILTSKFHEGLQLCLTTNINYL